MERPILTSCPARASFVRKGATLSLNTSHWLFLADACQDLASSFSTNGPNGKRLIVQLFLPGTSIRIDIRNVKAAGVLCVLGISFGIGTYVLYKIYDKYFRPVRKDKKSKKKHNKDHDSCHIETDEGIMGNQQSSLADIPVYYKKGFGVSLYNPSDTEHLRLRHRQSGVHITELDNQSVSSENFDKNPKLANGMVAITGSRLHEKDAREGGRMVPDISSLKINIDESGFVEDEGTDMNYDKVSIMGNFSPTSLYEKNCRYGLRSDLDMDAEENEADHNNVNVNNNSNGANMDRLNIDTTLKASSVLLTPPSEDETTTSSSRPVMSPSTHQSTKSDVSDIRSEIAEPYANEQAETDEEREKMSPLPLDQSPKRTPDRIFKKKLILKLNEISSRTHVIRSNNSSACSSPERVNSRPNSVSAEYENSISGISSPELELLHSESSEGQVEIPKPFVQLEEEIHHVEDEFETISKKIEELTSKYSNPVADPGSQIIDSIFERYPSIRVRQTERGIHFDHLSSLSETESSNNSRYTIDTEDKSINETDEKSTDNDLSWDLENILDVVYSESSESIPMQNPVVKRLAESERSLETSRRFSTGQDSVFGNSTDFDGTLYEDAFHLQLGTTKSPKVAENDEGSGQVANILEVNNRVSTNGGVQSEPTVCNISERLGVQDYAENEWRGGTQRADNMKKAYAEIPNHCRCCHLRRIRGDNYCAIRGAVFQILVNNIPPRHRWASKHMALKCLSDAYCDINSGLSLWTFAKRISYNSDDKLELMSRCVSTLYDKFEELNQNSDYTQREQVVADLLNSDLQCDLDLMEGVKLLMYLSALNLHGDMHQGNEVPVFGWLMFARDTSEDIVSFVKNHLNSIGDTGGLEQVEMFLLGYALGVRIEVFRLSQFGEDDFISYYPDDCSKDWPTISLIAEDDRHYNVPVL